ncbi:transcription termination factor Rho [Nocardioides sp.]|uniref:transcription termination factor Rho n=1 Tax=Nocardioides sp. TaxID=35761 RepID=UPI0027347B12|nr:transcription termination factor Rho [Nocardioides sp.]MDP3891183.1 transcription termination factor Rho [Nocardioides sp.]
MLIADLKAMAGGMGISGAGSMKKAQLIEAIRSAQGGGSSASSGTAPTSGRQQADKSAEKQTEKQADKSAEKRTEKQADQSAGDQRRGGRQREQDRPQGDRQREQDRTQSDDRQPARARGDRQQGDQRQERPQDRQHGDRQQESGQADQQQESGRADRQQESGRVDRQQESGQADRQQDRARGDRQPEERDRDDRAQGDRQQGGQARDEEGGSRRNRRRRGRDRDARPAAGGGGAGGRSRNEPDTQILEDDVLVPAAGILDVLDNYAFVRTSGYLPGSDDVYLSLSMVRKFGLRRGDAIVGQVRQPREGERKEKFNPMVRIDSVNGADPESAKSRADFASFTPLHASERLRLETDQQNLIGRVIDIAAPIGKGQRGLIVSPPKAGKTVILQSIANSIVANNPECHLMIVLVDERPEEVTDFQRTVKGEVIASTFDRPASDHTMVAELAIERAKRLVELGHDVVVLLDSITRLGRAYNLAAPASGRILSGGVDSSALYPPKRFFGAARNIENGGSLTILATALIETGSKMDEVIFEEFKGTGNMELRLRREFADKRIFPAIDAVQSGTRREELLMSQEETSIVWKLRRVLSGLDGQQALELLLERLKKSHSNIEFLMQVQKTTPTAGGSE